ISCPADDPALNPLHGEALCSSPDYEYKTMCSTSCKSGYTPLDRTTIECQANKMWSNSLKGCTDNEKPIVNDCPADIYRYAERNSQPTRVSWTVPTAVDNSGEATITQIEGKAPGSLFSPGTHKIVYTASDANGNESPNCTFHINVQDLMCTPPTISDRYLTFTCPTGYNFGSFCELSCMGNFPLVGNDTITCEQKRNGTTVTAYWDVGNEIPYCKSKRI
ncbi:sushi repeat-containing protein SRPX-like, partial [Saccostrea cucullata]|uniref:sushi repeat-containing protein SRPX-like n=1 Tax=Saccostrea cuccullata TaxID=36930 RepID=UPI002ECFFDE7